MCREVGEVGMCREVGGRKNIHIVCFTLALSDIPFPSGCPLLGLFITIRPYNAVLVRLPYLLHPVNRQPPKMEQRQ